MHLYYSLWQKSVSLPFTRQHCRPPRPKAGEFILQVHQSVLGRHQLWYAVIICRIRRHHAWIEIQGALTTKPAHFTRVGVSPRDPPFSSVGLFLIQGNSAESLSLQHSPYLFLEHISSPSVGISSLLLTLSGDKGNSGGAACYLHWILLAFVCPEVWFISLVVSFGSFWTVIQACKAFLRLQCHSPTPNLPGTYISTLGQKNAFCNCKNMKFRDGTYTNRKKKERQTDSRGRNRHIQDPNAVKLGPHSAMKMGE